MATDKCDCGTTTRIYFANVQLFTEPGPSGSGFSAGEVEVEVCQNCGKAEFVIPNEVQRRLMRWSAARSVLSGMIEQSKGDHRMHITSIDIDLARRHFIWSPTMTTARSSSRGSSRVSKLLTHTANLQPALMGIEACSGAHFIGTALPFRS